MIGNGTIGFTYDLKQDYLDLGMSQEAAAEFDEPETIDGLAGALESLGFAVDRIGNVKSLTKRLAAGDRWGLVFNICEGLSGFGREAQVPALLDAYGIPYTFSDPLVMALTLHKGMTKHVVRDLGVATPDFMVVSCPKDLSRAKLLRYPLFVKPVGEGTSKGISAASKIEDDAALSAACERLLGDFGQPVLVESFLPGREFTVGIVGTGAAARVLGVMEVHFGPGADNGAYSFHNKKHYQDLVRYSLCKEEPLFSECESLALKVWEGLGCRDGGRVDVRLDENGKPQFLEVNPLAGLNPLHSDLCILAALVGMEYRTLIATIIESAWRRVQPSEALRLTSEAALSR